MLSIFLPTDSNVQSPQQHSASVFHFVVCTFYVILFSSLFVLTSTAVVFCILSFNYVRLVMRKSCSYFLLAETESSSSSSSSPSISSTMRCSSSFFYVTNQQISVCTRQKTTTRRAATQREKNYIKKVW